MTVTKSFVEQISTLRQRRRTAVKTLLTTGLIAGGGGASSRNTHALHRAGPARDIAILQFTLNLEYLESEFYSYATTGTGVEAQGVDVTGSGTPGPTIIKDNPRVPFQTEIYQQFAEEELRKNEVGHTKFIRETLIALGAQPVARPTINLRESFTSVALAAGLITQGQTFDPFADEVSFLLATFLFEDNGYKAIKGATRLLSNKDVIESGARILAEETYHQGITRLFLYQIGATAREAARKISDLRDSLDRPEDTDQPLELNGRLNLVPTDANGIVFSRSPREILNIVYGARDASSGGFFPNGLNGDIR